MEVVQLDSKITVLQEVPSLTSDSVLLDSPLTDQVALGSEITTVVTILNPLGLEEVI